MHPGTVPPRVILSAEDRDVGHNRRYVFLLYNFLLTLFAPIWAPWMWFRSRKRDEPVIWDERFGIYKFKLRKDSTRLWFHAVSVGEIIAAKPILQRIRAGAPDVEIILSVTTSSGHRTAREQLSGLFDHLIYFPIDVARFQLRAVAKVRPKVVAIMETELWMNFLWAAKVIEAKTFLINGRISRNYEFSRKISFFYRELFKSVDRVLAQSETDRERLTELGAKNVEVFGNVKFDQAISDLASDPEDIRLDLGIPEGRKVIVIGSTRSEAEERLVIDALRQIGLHNLTIIHAPRHIERAKEIGILAEQAFGSVAYRSRKESGDYLILDTYGELVRAYAVADVVIVGGGFDDLGGQNIIQPMAAGKPVIHGPHMKNFREAAAAGQEVGATLVCATENELSSALKTLLEDMHLRIRMGESGKALISRNLGAADRYAAVLLDALNSGRK